MNITISFAGDPSWWTPILPYIGPAVIASLTVLFGFVLYKFQRKIDRKEKLHDEKRDAYRTYLKDLNNYLIEVVKKDGEVPIFVAAGSAGASLALVKLYAGKEISLKASDAYDTITELKNRKDAKEKQPVEDNNQGLSLMELATLMRKDLESDTDSGFFKRKKSDGESKQ